MRNPRTQTPKPSTQTQTKPDPRPNLNHKPQITEAGRKAEPTEALDDLKPLFRGEGQRYKVRRVAEAVLGVIRNIFPAYPIFLFVATAEEGYVLHMLPLFVVSFLPWCTKDVLLHIS